MEEQQKNQRTITLKHKRKRNNHGRNLVNNFHTIFALMLASLRASSASATINTTMKKKKKKRKKQQLNSYHQLLLQLLNQLHLSLLSKTPNSPPLNQINVPILSLLPLLLTSTCAEIVCKCAEFVGAALLFSLEMNEQIANDEGTVKGLIFALASSKSRNTSIATCNAVLDMATTSIGRQRLVESSALDCLM